MKNLVRLAAATFAVSSIASAAPGDMVSTTSKVILTVQVQNSSASATYYFTAAGGWSAPGCNGTLYAYINEHDPGAKAILAAALSSKATGTPITFGGVCGDSAGNELYIQIRYTTY